MKRLPLLAVVSWLSVCYSPSLADFADGLAAFDAGDYESAYAEWRDLAEAGDLEAQVALAALYLSGKGTPADPVEARRWYRLAAERGDPVAQLNLGDIYGRGLGVPPDPVSAYVWFSLAAEQGRRWPDLRRRAIAENMTPEQRAEVEARLAAWRQTH